MSAAAGASVPAAGGAPAAGQAQDGAGWSKLISKGLLMYFGMNAASGIFKQVMGPKESLSTPGLDLTATSTPGGEGKTQSLFAGNMAQSAAPSLSVLRNTSSRPFWNPREEKLDFYVFLSWTSAATHDDIATQISPLSPGGTRDLPPLEELIDFSSYPSLHSDDEQAVKHSDFAVFLPSSGQRFPILKAQRVTMHDVHLSTEVALNLPDEVRLNNGSIWADVVLVKTGRDVRVAQGRARTRRMLTRLMPSRKNREGRKLLTGASPSAQLAAEEFEQGLTTGNTTGEEDKRLITYWHSNLTLVIPKQESDSGLAIGQLPPSLAQYLHLVPDIEDPASLLHVRTGDGQPVRSEVYNYPVMFPNTFWDMREDMYPINSTTPVLPLHITVDPTSWFKFQLLAAMGDSFDKQGAMGGGELDILKHTLLHTSPWYLMLIVVVTILHLLFEFLAFSSDVSYWKKKDNLTGISVGTIMTSIVTQTIILLYLIDSSEETSWMILGSQAMGVAVESWKLTKALTVNVKAAPPGSLIPYRLDVQDKHVLSKEELETKEYDRVAFKIVAAGAAPLLIGYGVYSALYEDHRGWWSFVIGTLTSFVYTFGFVALIPQLIVNYKSKSVAGMNGKTLIYKIIGTFTDDIFAWGITKMPMMHRLATLRDDVVFFVYLYQWWIYGVDKSRVNEFGQILEPTEEMKKRGGLIVGKRADLAAGADGDGGGERGQELEEKESKKDK